MDRESKQSRKRHREELIAQRMREDAAHREGQKPAAASGSQAKRGLEEQPQQPGKPRLPE